MCSAIIGRSRICCITNSEYEISGFFCVHTLHLLIKKNKTMKKQKKKSRFVTLKRCTEMRVQELQNYNLD